MTFKEEFFTNDSYIWKKLNASLVLVTYASKEI